MNTFEKIFTDEEILKVYNKINYNEEQSEAWAHHDFNHAKNVTNMVDKLLTKLNYSEKLVQEAKIAAILHDTGMVDGKKDHEIRGYEFAKDYFKRKNIKLENEELVLDAIKSHRNGFDTENVITLALVLSDKLDVKYTRIAKDGYNIKGMKEVQYIKEVNVDITNNTLIVEFICDDKMNKKEFEEYYFADKMVKAVKAFAQKMNLNYNVLYNGKKWEIFF